MSTITVTTTSNSTITREELGQIINRLPTGGDTRTEIIDDETGEVLCTCQNGQVQITVETLTAVLTQAQNMAPKLSASSIYDRWRIGDRCRLLTTQNDDFRAGDIVIINGLDTTDDSLPIRVTSDDEYGANERWVHECDIVHVNG